MARCPSCGLEPKSEAEKARSLILSLDYEIEGVYRGKSKDELRAISEQIRSGKPFEFDEREVAEVIKYANSVASIPRKKLLTDMLKWAGPPVLLLLGLLILLWATK